MIPRSEIEFTLAMAEKGVRAEAPAEVMAELCRVYLAWLDAPVARPLELQCRGHDDPGRERLEALVKSGKRVRLVEVE